jgi:hypothetical protein
MLARERDFCLHFSAERDLFIRRGMGRETFSFARLVGGNEWKSVQPAVASSDVIDVLCCAMRKSNRNFAPLGRAATRNDSADWPCRRSGNENCSARGEQIFGFDNSSEIYLLRPRLSSLQRFVSAFETRKNDFSTSECHQQPTADRDPSRTPSCSSFFPSVRSLPALTLLALLSH